MCGLTSLIFEGRKSLNKVQHGVTCDLNITCNQAVNMTGPSR